MSLSDKAYTRKNGDTIFYIKHVREAVKKLKEVIKESFEAGDGFENFILDDVDEVFGKELLNLAEGRT